MAAGGGEGGGGAFHHRDACWYMVERDGVTRRLEELSNDHKRLAGLVTNLRLEQAKLSTKVAAFAVLGSVVGGGIVAGLTKILAG